MKLRNKKTGEIVEDAQYRNYSTSNGFGIRTATDEYFYMTLKEFFEEWEDCTYQEPLIKDEKLRKAIRAFAELHDSKTITFEETFGGASFISRADNGYSMLWVLGKTWGGENLKCDKPYTIAELCGEEE